jgi:hypothetical protein
LFPTRYELPAVVVVRYRSIVDWLCCAASLASLNPPNCLGLVGSFFLARTDCISSADERSSNQLNDWAFPSESETYPEEITWLEK